MRFPFAGAILLLTSVAAQADPTRYLLFASDNILATPMGKFQPGRGWIQSGDFYEPPQPGTSMTIFGTAGRLGEATLLDYSRPNPNGVPGAWSARISRGETKSQPFALAIAGSWPDTGERSTALALDDSGAVRIAAEYLKSRRLKRVDGALLTEAYQVDLLGDGQMETVLCAHSDASALRDDQEANVYAVTLLHFKRDGRENTLPLASQASWKPAGRTIDEHEHYYGKREFDRLLAFHDIDGDGRREIVLYRARDAATQLEVFTFDGRRLKKVLTAYKQPYN